MKKINILLLVLILLMPLTILFGCDQKSSTIAFWEDNATVWVDETYDLKILFEESGRKETVTYSVADENVAYLIPGQDKILALKDGQTKVFARSKSGNVAEMTVTVVSEKLNLLTPSGLTFDLETQKLRWFPVLNAYSYDVVVWNNGEVKRYETFSHELSFQSLNIDYSEDTRYEFAVTANASPNSKTYITSFQSGRYFFKQVRAVSNLRYEDQAIHFKYELTEEDLDEMGVVQFQLNVLKEGDVVISRTFSNIHLIGDEISFDFLPTEAGEYIVKVFVGSENLAMSRTKEIQVIKLMAPRLTVEDGSVFAEGEAGSSFKVIENSEEKDLPVEGVMIPDLLSGEESVYEAHAYRADEGDRYYIDSESTELIVKKLETPTDVQLKGIVDDIKGIEINWNSLYTYDKYTIKVFDEALNDITPARITFSISQSTNIAKIEDFFSNSGTYAIQLQARKVAEENVFYLSSEIVEKNVVKLSAPEIEYTILKEFKIISAPINIGAKLNLIAFYKDSEYKLFDSEEIISEDTYKGISGLEIDSGVCVTESYMSRDAEEDTFYLKSETRFFNINKIDQPILAYEYNNSKLILSWDRIDDAEGYEIKSSKNNSIPILYTGTITERDGKMLIEVSNLEDGADYEITVKAKRSYASLEDGIHVQYLDSEISEIEIKRLSRPNITSTSKKINEITFHWEPIDEIAGQGIYYEIYIGNEKVASTPELSYTCRDLPPGHYSFSVVASSDDPNKINSSRTTKSFTQIPKIEEIYYEKISEDSAEVSVLNIFTATYELTIIKPDETEVVISNSTGKDGRRNFTIDLSNIFTMEGEYTFSVRVYSPIQEYIENEPAIRKFAMLSRVLENSIKLSVDNDKITWEKVGGEEPSNYEIRINGETVDDYNFLNGRVYDISYLSPGPYSVGIIAKGDNESTIDSFERIVEILKKEHISGPAIESFGKDVLNDDSFELIFSEVDYAVYYQVYIACIVNDVFSEIFVSDKINRSSGEQSTYYIDRSVFSEGSQYIFVRACVDNDSSYASSVVPNLTSPDCLNCVMKIWKFDAEIERLEVTNSGSAISLSGYDSIINGQSYSNIIFDISELGDGERWEILVRNAGVNGDSFSDLTNTFYMAGEWVEFTLERLQSPEVTIESEGVAWGNYSNRIESYSLQIDYFGIGETLIKSISFDVPKDQSYISYLGIISRILDGQASRPELFVGNYKIYIKSLAVDQANKLIFMNSLKGESPEFVIQGRLDTSQIISEEVMSSQGTLEFSTLERLEPYLSAIRLDIIQAGSTATLKIYLNGDYEIISNDLADFETDFYTVERRDSRIYFSIKMHSVIDSGIFYIDLKALGNEVYTLDSESDTRISCRKLDIPTLSYDIDQYGNYLGISNKSNYWSSVVFYAEYENEVLMFDGQGRLLLPYSWEQVNNIKVYAFDETPNVVVSDKINVSTERRNSVENLRIENDEDSDKTFLVWDAGSYEGAWYVYIFNQSTNNERSYIASSRKFDLSEFLSQPGKYTLKVSAQGIRGSVFNSNLQEIEVRKLDSAQIDLNNANGVLNWNIPTEIQGLISGFRLWIGNDKLSFDNDIHSDSLSDLSGKLEIQIRVIGDASQNVISSDYTAKETFYKFEAPSTFKISQGEFKFEEIDHNIKEGYYRIIIETETYSYGGQPNVQSISEFYKKDINSGIAFAYIAGGTPIVVDNREVWALNSERVSLSFNRLQVDFQEEEKYLTQSENNGQITTLFHWGWTELGNVENRSISLYLKPQTLVEKSNQISGWDIHLKDDGIHVEYYKLIISANSSFNGQSTVFTIEQAIPYDLFATTYELLVQKNDTSSSGYTLSSRIHKAIDFVRLETPNLSIQDGRLNWQKVANSKDFSLIYSSVSEGLNGQTFTENKTNYELGELFSAADSEKVYNFKAIAWGNIPHDKPAQIPANNYIYVMSSKTSANISVLKPRTVGALKLVDGGLRWDEEYTTYSEAHKIEFAFYNPANTELVKILLDPDLFSKTSSNPSQSKVLDFLFGNIKAALSSGEGFIIKYRELGGTDFANSEYRTLLNNIVVEGDPTASIKFKVAPTVNNIYISNEGLSWSPISIPSGDTLNIIYDIFFRLNNGGYIYATHKTQTSISIDDLNSLNAFIGNADDIVGVFVVVRGNNENYISGFSSQILLVKAISQNMTLSIKDGVIRWNDVAGAASYEIKATVGSSETVYRVYKQGNVGNYTFYIDKYVNNELINEGIISQSISLKLVEGNLEWSWDLAQDVVIESGLVIELEVRYIPQSGGTTFAIPGKYSSHIPVLKLGEPTFELDEGSLVWGINSNAKKYNVYIKYLFENNDPLIEVVEVETNRISLMIKNKGQTGVEVAIQAVGWTGAVQGRYIINSNIEYHTMNCKENTIDSVELDGDKLKWQDNLSGNEYELMIESTEGGIFSKIIGSGKEVDLSTLGLSSGMSYSAYLKVVGESGFITARLSSIVLDAGITFQVFPQVEVDDFKIEDGNVVWKISENNSLDYKLEINSFSGKTYTYKIVFNGSKYVIASFEANGVPKNSVSLISREGEYLKLDIKDVDAETSSSYNLRLRIAVTGKTVEETRFISSGWLDLSSKKAAPPAGLNFEIDDENVKFVWNKKTNYLYNVIVEDSSGNAFYEINNLDANRYNIERSNFNPGETYTFKVQIYSNVNNEIKSNFAIIEFVIPQEEN